MPKGKMAPPPKKGKKGLHEEVTFATVSPSISKYIDQIKQDVAYLQKLLFQWSLMNSNKLLDRNERTILRTYIQNHHNYYEYDQFDSSFALLDTFNINFQRIVSDDIIYKSFDLFRKCLWPVRFNRKFVARLNDYSYDEMLRVLGEVMMLASGRFPNIKNSGYGGYVRAIDTKSMPLNRFFSYKLHTQKNMLIHIGVEKLPILSRNSTIKRYEFKNYLHILDILGDQFIENKNKLQERITMFRQQILEDVAKKDHSEEIELDSAKMPPVLHRAFFFGQAMNPYTEQNQIYQTTFSNGGEDQSVLYHPLPIKPFYISTAQTASLVFDTKIKRWVSQEFMNHLEKKKIKEFQRRINDEMIKRFVDFQSAKTLVELLTKIPNFKVNLTDQEKDVIGENGNVLAIGRSGTGKTTCAVLRLFSIEMLFKIRLSLFKKKHQSEIKDARCSSDDIDEAIGLHSIFLTASPVLTHEIQRYYRKLTDNIKDELEKKKKRVEVSRKKEEEERKKQEEEERKKQEEEKAQEEVSVEIVESSFEDINMSKEEQINQKEEQINPKMEEQINPKEEQINPKEEHINPKEEQINPKMEEHINPMEEHIIPESLAKTQSNKSAECLQEQIHMTEELKDLQLKDDVNNQNFQDEDFDELKNKFEENIKNFHSLDDLEEKDYPGFFTVKSYIMMIDGVLPKPFFIRKKNIVLDQDSKAAWHNEKKGVMMIQNYFRNEGEEEINQDGLEAIEEEINYSDEEELEHEYMRQIQLKQNKGKQLLTKKLGNKKAQQLSFQVDYDYFLTHFWPNIQRKYYSTRNITAHLVWTQIYSTIKGSAFSHLYPGLYLTESAYIQLTSNVFLSKQEKKDIYEAFCQYQRWKIKAGGYDIMDTVNYVLNYIRYRGYQGPQIHYIMIDQVQDLPHAMVYLLSKTATYGVFYSGDTAQTIAKGVGFRFCDLKSLFNNDMFEGQFKLKAPVIKHLTINFRSHNNILQLANSVVSSLEILFPKTIDRMKKEVSDLAGPKPMILADADEELLFYVLCGEEGTAKKDENNMKKPPLEFGCDQVIIVRDQQSKAKIPAMLQHALCLTIYEAKGLQFNDVILFNFFSETKCPEKWNLLKYLNIVDVQMKKEEYEASITKHKQQEAKEKGKQPKQGQQKIDSDVEFTVKQDKEFIKIKKIVSDVSKVMKDINDYAELCSELKLLYTAITRPRKALIIFDEDSAPRKNIQRMWERLQIIEVISNDMILESNKKASEDTQEIKVFKRIINSTDTSEWKKQGMRMYSRGYFEQAMKCFERSGNKDLYQKAEANRYADQATKKLISIESDRSALKQGYHIYKNMTNTELSKLKKQLKTDEAKAYKQFQIASEIFESLHMFKQAGQCYFSGKKFDKAYECFCKAFMNKQAAESLQMQNKYRQAAEYYEKEDDYLKVIECLDMINEWSLILQKIQKYSMKMSELQKQSLLKKYSALALEELVYQIEFQHQSQENKPENNRVEVIEEKDSDEEQQLDSQEDPQLAADRAYERKISEELSSKQASRKQSELSQDGINKTQEIAKKEQIIMESVYQKNQPEKQVKNEPSKQIQNQSLDSFEDINTSKPIVEEKEKSPVKQVSESSFSQLIDQNIIPLEQKVDLESIESSFSDINAKYENQLQPDLESIKSLVDPDDMWVKHSISQIEHKAHSEFSVIDGDEENYNTNVKIIKTKGNIFIQDEIMQKIVSIVSIINTSVHEFFKQFKGYQSLITLSNEKGEADEIDNRPQISQFEDIDPQFINIILDTLESFKLFKLCLFVCNRYHMPNKAGRYLTSISMKYSTNCQSINSVNPSLLAPSTYRKNELEKGILASIAMHAILENVNSDFLKIKIEDNQEKSKNSLGSYFIQGLILQGMFKKTIFMVNPKQALQILFNYNDWSTYHSLFRQKVLKNDEQSSLQLSFLPQPPKTSTQSDLTIVLLKKVLFEYHVAHRIETIGNRYYKEFHEDPLNHDLKLILPNYLPFSKILIENREAFATHFGKIINRGYDILKNGKNYEIFDLVSTIMVILHSQQLQNQICHSLDLDSFLELYRCINFIEDVSHKIHTDKSIEIIDSILNFYQVTRVKPCKSMSFFNDGYSFIHRTSIIANEFVQNKGNSYFAYFIEQDYNLIIVKTVKVLKFISKRLDAAVSKFYHKRSNIHIYQDSILPEDFANKQGEEVLNKALKAQVEMTHKKDTKKQVIKAPKPATNKTLMPSFDFKMHGKEEYAIHLNESSQSQQENQFHQEIKTNYTMPSFNPKMQYLLEPLLYLFLNRSKNSKEVVTGKQLYCSNLNSYYRQYVDNQGGYHLFDAIQFIKFKRIDLYAENIYSVIDNLSLGDKHIFTSELLILLMIQHKRLVSGNKFKIELTKNVLKFLPGLKFIEALGNKKEGEEQPRAILHDNFFVCSFSYKNQFSGELSSEEIAEFICDYLSIIQQEEASQFVNFQEIILALVLNIDPDEKIYNQLRKIIGILRSQWKSIALNEFIAAKNFIQFCQKRQKLITRERPPKGEELLHEIIVDCVGNIQKSIEDSEHDYAVQGKIIEAKKKAASKIIKWWKKHKIDIKERARLNIANYFDYNVKTRDEKMLKTTLEQLQDVRLMQAIHKEENILYDIPFLVRAEASRDQLLSFYLSTVISSSLDFHFILMTLNKIQDYRTRYFQISKKQQEEFIQEESELNGDAKYEVLSNELKQTEQTIIIWKNDSKWLKEKNINLKRKKVFEVKWMTKNLHLNKIIKKRAGLKKQEKLQQKRKMIKRMEGT